MFVSGSESLGNSVPVYCSGSTSFDVRSWKISLKNFQGLLSIVQLSMFFLLLPFHATAFILYQSVSYLSTTFLFLFCCCEAVPHATAYLGYHFQNSLSTTFLIYFSIISLIFKSSSFLPIKNVPPPRLLSSSVTLLFSLLFLSDECYLITAVFNCQCFLYISCNSDYSEN